MRKTIPIRINDFRDVSRRLDGMYGVSSFSGGFLFGSSAIAFSSGLFTLGVKFVLEFRTNSVTMGVSTPMEDWNVLLGASGEEASGTDRVGSTETVDDAEVPVSTVASASLESAAAVVAWDAFGVVAAPAAGVVARVVLDVAHSWRRRLDSL